MNHQIKKVYLKARKSTSKLTNNYKRRVRHPINVNFPKTQT